MKDAFTIQSLDNSHCEAVVNLILPIQQVEFNLPLTLDGQRDLLDIQSHYHKTGGDFWGAFHNQELAGTIALIATGHNAGAIRKMFVKKEFRGKEMGIAQQLLNTLIVSCAERDIRDLYLSTIDVLKAAHRFYERNGFKTLEKADLPGYFPLMNGDNVYYHLQLNHSNEYN